MGWYDVDVFSSATERDRVPRWHRDAQAPHGAYAGIMGTFAAGLAVAVVLGRALGRDPRGARRLDLARALGAATFKTARTISRDEVTSFIRQPFVEGEAHEGGEEPLETGDLHQAIGELVTCTAASAPGPRPASRRRRSLAPRFGRLLTWSLAAAGANDFLQAGFAALTSKSNELQRRGPRSG